MPDTEEPIGAVFHRTAIAIRRALDVAISAQVSPELTGLRGMVLGYIVERQKREEPVYQRDLETRFHINRSSVTALLQGLEQSGFIVRTPVEQDARLKRLAPTEKGLACTEAIHTCVRSFEDRLRTGISSEQIMTTYQVVRCLLQNVEEMDPAPDNQPDNEKKG